MIIAYKGRVPNIAPDAFIAPNATVIGNVDIGSGASVWFGAVLRGDANRIVIGAGSNVQDNAVLHCSEHYETIVGANVTIGHAAVLEGCHIGDGALIGMNATVLHGSKVGAGAIIAAGGVVAEHAIIPPRTLAAGVPAKVKRELGPESIAMTAHAAAHYQALKDDYA